LRNGSKEQGQDWKQGQWTRARPGNRDRNRNSRKGKQRRRKRKFGFICSSHIHLSISDNHAIQPISTRSKHACRQMIVKNKQQKKLEIKNLHHIVTSSRRSSPSFHPHHLNSTTHHQTAPFSSKTLPPVILAQLSATLLSLSDLLRRALLLSP
jgi:hypothetical protein